MESIVKGTLAVCKPECMHCTHLVSFAEDELANAKTFECTADNGNDMCPAQAIIVVLGANIDKASSAIVRAFRSGDAAQVATRMKKLASYHETIQSQIMAEVQARLSVQAPVEAEATTSDVQPPADGEAQVTA